MAIELAVLVAVVAVMGAAVVKFYEWHQGVLYGPYLAPLIQETKRPVENHDTE
jgi:hypothetical protein